MAARPSWQGHLRLSLVTCPVVMYNALSARSDVHFNLINPDTGNRIRMITVDAGTEEPLERKNLVKGFEVAKGEYVIVTPEEIENVRLESTKTIDIDRFVPAADIDRLYWDNPYYLMPDGNMAAEAFTVIKDAMQKSGKVALGRVVMSQRERLLALEVRDDGIIATTLRTREEVKAPSSIVADAPAAKADKDMVSIAERIIAQKEGAFDPDLFEDRYENALRELIAEKQKGHQIARPTSAPLASNVIDLMDALKKSLNHSNDNGRSSSPSKRAAAAPAQKAKRTTAKAPVKKATTKKAPTKKPAKRA